MERFTISLDEKLAKEFDRLIRSHGYSNRSEAVRDILRQRLEASRLEREEAPDCIAALSYIYNHHERDLAERLTAHSHDHHDLTVSTMHAHLDHDHCMEVIVMKGPAKVLQRAADQLLATKGVQHGKLVCTALPDAEHAHHHHP